MDKAPVTAIYFVAEFMAEVPVIKLNTTLMVWTPPDGIDVPR